MNKKRRKNKRSKNNRVRSLSVQQEVNLTARTSYRPANVITQPRQSDHITPRFGEKILYFFLSKEESENKIGDLAEHYSKLLPILGSKGARLWYYKEVGFLLWRKLPKVTFITLYSWIEEQLRRHIK